MTFLGWHRWIALFLGLFIAIQGMGGTLLLFRQPLNHLLHPDAYIPAAPALDANVDAVRACCCTITRIDLPDRATDPLFFHLFCNGDPFMATAGGCCVWRRWATGPWNGCSSSITGWWPARAVSKPWAGSAWRCWRCA